MNRRNFLKTWGLAAAGQFLSGCFPNTVNRQKSIEQRTFHARLIRNATVLILVNDKSILVDPMLAEVGTMDPMPMTANKRRNPLVSLPLSNTDKLKLVQFADAVLLTHLHPDHWDEAAQALVPKDKLIFCQKEDRATLVDQGFTNVMEITNNLDWQGINIQRTGGQHGKGEIGKMMAPVSGYLLTANGECLYIAGDTIWCDEVLQTLEQYAPDYTIVNAGAAEFSTGGPITMTSDDVLSTASHTRNTVIAVHMEAINHCGLRRSHLREIITKKGLSGRVLVPNDGEWFL